MYSNELVCNILNYVNNNIYEDINIDLLSNKFNYDKTYLMKKFKKELGITIKEYINYIKIFNNLDLYNYNNKILSIAIRSGYNSIEYYSEIFKKVIGVSPRTYKNFILHKNNITNEEIDIIKKSINNIMIINSRVNKYLSNRRILEYKVRKRSIFE